MGEPLKILLAAAIVVLLAAAGWRSWSEWRANSERNEGAQVEEEGSSQARDVEREQQRLAECREDIAAWEANDPYQLEEGFGREAERVVENCRWMLEAQSSERAD